MTRVIILGDPSKEVGSLAEPECARILAALDLAERMRVPLEWFALSAGAKISMESGTENMDWIAKVLRRLIEFTQAGHEINIIVIGINVGGQPYWNAEATMLMHTRGILVMTPDGAMVLTGKTALDYSGSVSAEDNQGIGGYEHIMGPNGQAQYWARDLGEACRILLRHYDHTYVAPGERFPRRAVTDDPIDARRLRLSRTATITGTGFDAGRRRLLRREEPGPQEAVRHPEGDARGQRPGSRAARALGAHARRRERRDVGRARRRVPGRACSASSRGPCRASASCRPTAPSSGPRARCSRWRRRRWRGSSTPPAACGRSSSSRTCRASTARPSRCAAGSSSSARRSAARSSTSRGRSSSS